MKVTFDKLNWYGRYLEKNGIRYFDYSASGFSFILKGKKAVATFVSDTDNWDEKNKAVLGIFEMDAQNSSIKSLPLEPTKRIVLDKNKADYVLFECEQEKTVCIYVMKFSECAFGFAGLCNLQVDGKVKKIKLSEAEKNSKKIEFIGDSITCGYGNEGVWEKDIFSTQNERPDRAYAFLTAKNLGAQVQLCSWSGIGLTSNYVDPETINLPDTHWLMPANWPYTDKSLSLRLKLEPEVWNENRFSPDLVVIHLGTNDISWVRGIEDRRLNFIAAYKQLLEAVHRRSPNAKIICMLGVMGTELNVSVNEAVTQFSADFPNVGIKFIPFDVQDEKDGIAVDWHPSMITHQKVAEKLTNEIKNFI